MRYRLYELKSLCDEQFWRKMAKFDLCCGQQGVWTKITFHLLILVQPTILNFVENSLNDLPIVLYFYELYANKS
jgi:hypothetical protein